MGACKAIAMILVLLGMLFFGCESGPRISTVEGTATFECDESLYPVMQLLAADFIRSYPKANIILRSVEAREATANFVMDSTRHIILGRELNKDEQEAVVLGKIEKEGYRVALDAVAVISHKSNPVKELSVGLLDSIFSAAVSRWPGRKGSPLIDVVIGGVNSSTNEVFREKILKGRALGLTAIPYSSSQQLVEYVKGNPNAIGIVGLSWLAGIQDSVTVFSLSTPGERPDTTQPYGRPYPPVQAHIHRGYYPLTRPVYIYNREVLRSVGYGFISYVNSAVGQKLFLSNGLVPVTMPVRLVNLTSQEVK
ncbi:MAG: PstS family phosphate ABC transporter substrate-binding protein [Bacteroidota bacterium]